MKETTPTTRTRFSPRLAVHGRPRPRRRSDGVARPSPARSAGLTPKTISDQPRKSPVPSWTAFAQRRGSGRSKDPAPPAESLMKTTTTTTMCPRRRIMMAPMVTRMQGTKTTMTTMSPRIRNSKSPTTAKPTITMRRTTLTEEKGMTRMDSPTAAVAVMKEGNTDDSPLLDEKRDRSGARGWLTCLRVCRTRNSIPLMASQLMASSHDHFTKINSQFGCSVRFPNDVSRAISWEAQHSPY
ncbi:uncharacterized protein PV07_06762 [Cladophialophora immunda]|uniref:Uncharacterized protein n=1 Tax=Cladophialophora immunda TaxID=569365 RepID=A0A0D2C939_9EURO|nr:uncharacterized protein PV07_06762 [Cladophialophora immunda]KIW26980.1 hypothetical protein PV07_06762 [Cladophialophora immunda]